MSVVSQILLLVERVSAELKAVTRRVNTEISVRVWTSTTVFRVGQYATSAGNLWRLIDVDGSTGGANVPPGPFRKVLYGGVYTSGASVAASVTNSDDIHGACFTIPDVTTITHVGTYIMAGTILAEDTVLNVWVGLASDPPPDEAMTPHGTIILWAGPQPSGATVVKLTTPWTPPVDTPLTVWFGPTGSPVVNKIKTTATGNDDVAVQSAMEYVVRPEVG